MNRLTIALVRSPRRNLKRFMSIVAVPATIIVTAAVSPAAAQKKILADDWSRGQLFELMGQYIEGKTPASDFQQFAFRGNFSFPHDAVWRNPVLEQDPRMDQIFGVALSHHNTDNCHCKIDWGLLAEQKVAFAYLKATQGIDYYDPKFDDYLQGIRALHADNRIQVGAFHFLSASGSAESQADNFRDVVGTKLGANDLTPSLDVEWDVRTANGKVILGPDGKPKDFWVGTDGKTILSRVLQWLKIVETRTHKIPIIYTNQVWWSDRIGNAGTIQQSLAHYPVWISDLSSKGLAVEQPYVYKGAWNLWQFSFTAAALKGGLPPGGTVDADVFDGSPDAFAKALKQ